MKCSKRIFILFVFVTLFIYGCISRSGKYTPETKIELLDTAIKSDYELADEHLAKLQRDKVDTIIFYKRTCIGCCDFFNIFWTSNGKYFLKKFHIDYDSHYAYRDVIKLNNAEIFKVLTNNYSALKNNNINASEPFMTHYCYAQVSVFTPTDTIETGRICDSDFDKNIGYIEAKNEKASDKRYIKNVESKWNTLLSTIENQLANMDQTSATELKTLRTKKHYQ